MSQMKEKRDLIGKKKTIKIKDNYIKTAIINVLVLKIIV